MFIQESREEENITWELRVFQSDHTLHAEEDHSEPGKLHLGPVPWPRSKLLILSRLFIRKKKQENG